MHLGRGCPFPVGLGRRGSGEGLAPAESPSHGSCPLVLIFLGLFSRAQPRPGGSACSCRLPPLKVPISLPFEPLRCRLLLEVSQPLQNSQAPPPSVLPQHSRGPFPQRLKLLSYASATPGPAGPCGPLLVLFWYLAQNKCSEPWVLLGALWSPFPGTPTGKSHLPPGGEGGCCQCCQSRRSELKLEPSKEGHTVGH